MIHIDDVVFISDEFDDEQSSKIVRVLNAHEIKTTTDINAATIIVKPAKKPQPQNNNLIVVVLAQKIEENKEEIIKMYDKFYQSMPRIEIPTVEIVYPQPKKHNKNKFIQNQTITKFNKIKYKHKQILFNRTRHK